MSQVELNQIDTNKDGQIDKKETEILINILDNFNSQEKKEIQKFFIENLKKSDKESIIILLENKLKGNKNNPKYSFIKNTINLLRNTSKIEKRKDISSFFEVSGEKIQKLDEKLLKTLGVEKISNILEGYKNYIEKNLSNLPKEQQDKVKLSIIRKFNSLKLNDFLANKQRELKTKITKIQREVRFKKIELRQEIKQLEKKHKENSSTLTLAKLKNTKKRLKLIENTYIPKIKDFRWEINEEITDKFSFVTNKLLPSLAFYSKNNKNIQKYNNSKDNAFLYKIAGNDMYHLEDKLEEINELLQAPIDENGNFNEGTFSTQNILDTKNGLDKKLLEKTPKLEGIDILSQEDKEKQAKAMATYISYTLIMMIPYAGDLASLPADVKDLLTNQEGTLQTLKEKGLVPKDFNMKKELWDYAFGGIGILASIASLVPVIGAAGQGIKGILKSGKLAKAYKMVSKLGIPREKFAKMLEESYEIIGNTLKDGLYTLGTNIQKHPTGKMINIRMNFADNKIEKLNKKYNSFDIVINGKGIKLPKLGQSLKDGDFIIERGTNNTIILKKINGEDFEGIGKILLIGDGTEFKIEGVKIFRPSKKVEKVGNYTYVKLLPETEKKVNKYETQYSTSYSKIAKETGLFEIGKGIDALGITKDKGGLKGVLGIMLSKKGIASNYSGPLTDGGKGGGFLKDTLSGLHGPYFIVKNSGNKKDYNYLFPDEIGIKLLKENLNSLEKAGEIQKSEIDNILARTFTYKDFVKFKKIEKNTKLSDIKRLEKTKQLLGGKKLSKEQKDAILKAHNIGKDREGAGVFNYTQAEIREKAKILKDAGFSKKETRVLMENGIVGKFPGKGFFDKIGGLFETISKKINSVKHGDIVVIDGGFNLEKGAYRVEKINGDPIYINLKSGKKYIIRQNGKKAEIIEYTNNAEIDGKLINREITSFEVVDNKSEFILQFEKSLKNGDQIDINGKKYTFATTPDGKKIFVNEQGIGYTMEEGGGNISLMEINGDIGFQIISMRKIEKIQKVEHLGIGDLHGEYKAFMDNLKAQNVIRIVDDQPIWSGGNKKIVFVGDILADRGTQGTNILEAISDLNKQAEKQGGGITVLAGNHDDWAIAFLTNTKISGGGDAIDNALNNQQGKGIIEFMNRFSDKKVTDFSLKALFEGRLNYEKPSIILNNMKNSPEGRKILKQMCNYKILEQIGDTLYTHTNMTQKMANFITKHGVDKINKIYQKNLKNMLLNGGQPTSEYKEIVDIFLYTDTRVKDYGYDFSGLKKLGITRIIHGHDDVSNRVIDGIKVRSIDSSYGKKGNYNRPLATSKVDENGDSTYNFIGS